MKKLTALMIAGLLLTVFASLASAQNTAFVPCSGIPAVLGASLPATGTSVCTITISIPAGSTLDDIGIMIEQDSENPTASNSTVTGTYTGSGLVSFSGGNAEVITESATSSATFGSCTGTPTAGPCPISTDYSYSGAGGTETVSYSLSGTNGGTSTFNGATGIDIFYNLSYASGTPEPATLGISGAGLIALGLIARKRRNRKVVG